MERLFQGGYVCRFTASSSPCAGFREVLFFAGDTGGKGEGGGGGGGVRGLVPRAPRPPAPPPRAEGAGPQG
jgi:hypothetical protein